LEIGVQPVTVGSERAAVADRRHLNVRPFYRREAKKPRSSEEPNAIPEMPRGRRRVTIANSDPVVSIA
jgi:hypothetical protein